MQKTGNKNLHLLVISLCVFTVLMYYFNIFCRFDQLIIIRQQEVIDGVSAPPNKYRILAPYISHFFSVISEKLISKPGHGLAFMLSMAVFISYTWYAFFGYIKLVFTDKKDLIISLFVFAVLLTASMNHHSYQPWSYLEAGFFLTAATLVKKNKIGFFYFLLSLVAVLNRETGFFLALIPLFYKITPQNIFKKEMLVCYLYVLGATAAFIGIRLITGNDPMESIVNIFYTNLKLMNLILLLPILISGFLLFFLKNFRQADPLKNSIYLFLLYLVPVMLFGRWIEIRMLLPFSYFLVPVIVYNIIGVIKQSVNE